MLVDTNVLIWFLTGHRRLSPRVRSLLEDPAATPMVSLASIWELAIKFGLGRLPVAPPDEDVLISAGFQPLGITYRDTLAAARLPQVHSDPFDRMLVAQADRAGLALLTADAALAAYGIDVIRA